jgi:integrase
MPRRKRLTDEGVAALPIKAKRYAHPDPELPGHYVRVFPSGAKSFVTVRQNKWTTIGDTRRYSIEQAREKARATLQGKSTPESFTVVAELWCKKHVEGLRSAREVRRHLGRLVDVFGARDFTSIRRKEIISLADQIAEKHGKRAGKYLLQVFSALARWYALRDQDYLSPIAPGMTKEFSSASRARVLTDEELRVIWKQAEANGTFGALVRLLLLTTQRHEKIVTMRWEDIDSDGVWTIPTAPGEKGNAGVLVLPQVALDIIHSQPRFIDNDYVLTGRGQTHFNSDGRAKREFDAKLAGVPHWTLHDLRRTASSLMARAGVRSDHAEQTLGHKIRGVAAIYNRFEYHEEKAQALRMLASLIDDIVHDRAESRVVKMRATRR